MEPKWTSYFELDKEFVCEAIGKATTFFKYGVLPELVGKYCTRESSECSIHTLSTETRPEIQNEASDGTETEKWCYCEQEGFGNMIFCEGDSSKRQWFHMDCLKLETLQRENGSVLTIGRKNPNEERNNNLHCHYQHSSLHSYYNRFTTITECTTNSYNFINHAGFIFTVTHYHVNGKCRF